MYINYNEAFNNGVIESSGAFWILLAIMFGIALLMSSIGFKKFVYFLSVGYGLAVMGIGIALIVFTAGKFEFVHIANNGFVNYILAVVFILYGCRLAGFLLFREIKSASYRKTLENVAGKEEKKMPFFVKLTIWISVGLLYVMQTYPVIYRVGGSFTSEGAHMVAPLIGAVIAIIGLSIETIADLQKSAAKKVNPHTFVSTGLFKFVRCPNYLGEIIFWTGIFISGVDIYLADWPCWIISILGYLLIVYVMVSGAKRLELRQKKNYGNDPKFQEYCKKTPILMHMIPVKSLENVNWIK